MYSPKRKEPTIERNDTISSPLRALTPIVDVIKTAQTNASRDFDRFYDNLWAKITPKTSNSRIINKTPETAERRSSMFQRNDNEMDNRSTSLTPLIERHSLREGSRASYEYTSRDPFYQDTESDIGETPGLERGVESPSSFLSYTPISAPNSSPRRSVVSHRQTIPASPRRTLLYSSNYMNQKFEEERKKMDKLQESVSHIRRQSSLLAEKSSRMANFLFDDDDDEEEVVEELSIPSKPNNNIQQLATPPYSIDYNKTKTQQYNSTPRYQYTHHTSPNKRSRSPSRNNESPVAKRIAVTTKKSPINHNNKIISPKRIILDDVPGTKLRSTEMITTPGGTMVSNRFWKEIHGLSSTRSPTTEPTTPITKRISSFQERTSKPSTSQTWANDDEFWSSESSPAPSSFNNKLLQIAQQEKRQKRQEEERKQNDMQWSVEAPVTSSSNHDFFLQEEEEEEEITPSLFKNKLSKEQRLSFSDRLLQLADKHSLSDELESAKKRQDILDRNNIPKMNPALLAELKAKHNKSKLIDDSDSYKFT